MLIGRQYPAPAHRWRLSLVRTEIQKTGLPKHLATLATPTGAFAIRGLKVGISFAGNDKIGVFDELMKSDGF